MSLLNYISTWDSNGVPINSNLIVKKSDGTLDLDTSIIDIKNRLLETLPESQDVIKNSPGYFSNDSKNILIRTQSSSFRYANIKMTFIYEGAGYQNCFGYYVYPLNKNNINLPTKYVNNEWIPMTYQDMMNPTILSQNNVKMILVFANASLPRLGGNLQSGFQIELIYDPISRSKNFPNNTGIGFFVIPNGWTTKTNDNKINVSRASRFIFSDYQFNVIPNPTNVGKNGMISFANGSQQTILLNDLNNTSGNSATYVLAFEDIMITTPTSGDRDYNDLVIKIYVEPGYCVNPNNSPPLLSSIDTSTDRKSVV